MARILLFDESRPNTDVGRDRPRIATAAESCRNLDVVTRYAAFFARAFDASLHFMYRAPRWAASPPEACTTPLWISPQALLAPTWAMQARLKLLTDVAWEQGGCALEPELVEGSLRVFARQINRSDFVVVGLRRRFWVWPFSRSSLVARLIAEPSAPILVIPETAGPPPVRRIVAVAAPGDSAKAVERAANRLRELVHAELLVRRLLTAGDHGTREEGSSLPDLLSHAVDAAAAQSGTLLMLPVGSSAGTGRPHAQLLQALDSCPFPVLLIAAHAASATDRRPLATPPFVTIH